MPSRKKKVWVFWDDAICCDCDINEFISVAKEKENDIFALFTPNVAEVSQENLIVMPITDYNNVLMHAADLETALKRFEK